MSVTWVLTLQAAKDYLRAALPEADIAMHGDAMLENIARRALRLRDDAPWGHSIPQEVFLPYVLFPRVNNEYLEDNGFISEQVFPLVKDLPMQEAALRVNLWCFEQATYRSTDIRTASPGAIIRAGFGRCGEESTLAVSALRSAGIPARQVYVPRWAHCDDNHAWVEVWVDGAWHYMGACEPEPQLDTGWFTAAASKAMMVHTRCYGLIPQTERVEKSEAHSCIINRTAAYAPTCMLSVHAVKNGSPAARAQVHFLLCNEAEFSPICEKETDAGGCVQLLTGFGGLMIEVLHEGRRLYRAVDLNEQNEITLDMADATPTLSAPLFFSLVPPKETRMQSVFPSVEVQHAHAERMRCAEQRRLARFNVHHEEAPFIRRAAGNADEIRTFWEDTCFASEDKSALLYSLSEKDLFDATADMLSDALGTALPYKAGYPADVWAAYILCPRIAFEKRLPVRQELARFPGIAQLRTASDVWRHVKETVTMRPSVPDGLYPDSLTALKQGFTTATGRSVLFVDLCRALGIPARLDPITDEPAYWEDGTFVSPIVPHKKRALLTLCNESGVVLPYSERFTIARVDESSTQTLALRGAMLKDELPLHLDAGQYLLTCVTRQIDGTVDGICTPVTLFEGEEKTLPVQTPKDTSYARLFRIPLPPIEACDKDGSPVRLSSGDFEGAGGILSFIAPGEEPTEHFLLELREKEKEITAKSIRLLLVVDSEKALRHERLKGLSFVQFAVSNDTNSLLTWRRLLRCGDVRKPLGIAIGKQGTALFAYANYHVGSVESLLRILDTEDQSLQ